MRLTGRGTSTGPGSEVVMTTVGISVVQKGSARTRTAPKARSATHARIALREEKIQNSPSFFFLKNYFQNTFICYVMFSGRRI